MKIKRLISLLCILMTCALVFCACGSKENNGDNNPTDIKSDTSVTATENSDKTPVKPADSNTDDTKTDGNSSDIINTDTDQKDDTLDQAPATENVSIFASMSETTDRLVKEAATIISANDIVVESLYDMPGVKLRVFFSFFSDCFKLGFIVTAYIYVADFLVIFHNGNVIRYGRTIVHFAEIG